MSSRPEDRTIDNWLNPDAFAEPEPGTFGNLGRNFDLKLNLTHMTDGVSGNEHSLRKKLEPLDFWDADPAPVKRPTTESR